MALGSSRTGSPQAESIRNKSQRIVMRRRAVCNKNSKFKSEMFGKLVHLYRIKRLGAPYFPPPSLASLWHFGRESLVILHLLLLFPLPSLLVLDLPRREPHLSFPLVRLLYRS